MSKVIIILAIISFTWLSNGASAQRTAESPVVMSVSKDSKAVLGTVQTIAMFLNGNDPLLTRIAEDAIGLQLTSAGFMITSREMLQRNIANKLADNRKGNQVGSVDGLEIGNSVKADAILTGTIIAESRENSSILIRMATFQLVDVKTGNLLLSILYEPEKGTLFSEMSKTCVQIIRKSTNQQK